MSKRNYYHPAESFFRKPYELDDRITRLKNDIERLNYLMLPSGIDYTKPLVSTSPDDVMAKYEAEKTDLQKELAELQAEYINERAKVKTVIKRLDRENSQGATILSEIYVSHKPIIRIAAEKGYERTNIYKIRNKALYQAQKYINAI